MTESYDARYFARVYGGFSNGNGAAQTVLDRLRDARISQLARHYMPDGDRRPAVLDVGCGYGWMLQRLSDAFALYGVDISPHALVRASARVKDAVIAAADVEQGIPFSRRFEAVLAVNVLEHLRDPVAAVRAICDALTPGGVAIVHLPTINNSLNRLIYDLTYDRDHTHVYRPSGKGIRALFESMGLVLIHHSYSPHIPRAIWHAAPWHPAYLAVFRRI